MADLRLPDGFNYIGVFLTLDCNYRCPYCINGSARTRQKAVLPAAAWADFFGRLDTRGVPLTLQGGEPTLYPGFYDLIDRLPAGLALDLLTNLNFDARVFLDRVPAGRFNRPGPYAGIRVSYHPQAMDLDATIGKLLLLQEGGHRVGLYGVAHPESCDALQRAKSRCLRAGIDFRVKPFLGDFRGVMYGRFRYRDCGALSRQPGRPSVMCRSSDLLLGPDGGVYRCHHDLYGGLSPVSSILDPRVELAYRHRPCSQFGFCELCDIKVKNNRFQEFGHTAVDMVFEGNPVAAPAAAREAVPCA